MQPMNTLSARRAAAQSGFTLVELIVVIVILGILSAVAVPRFINLQVDARKAKLSAIAGSIKAAAALAKSQALVGGVSCSSATGTSVSMEGTTVNLSYCYPDTATTAANSGIIGAANINATADGLTLVNPSAANAALAIQVTGATTPASCQVSYTPPAAANGAPTITITDTAC